MSENGRILIIEDDDKLRSLLDKVLNREGYWVKTSSDGFEALNMIKQETFDLVLTDIKMPKIEGMEVLRVVKEHAPETVVIMMTAFGSVDSAVEAMKAGAYDYISKPFKMDEILLVVQKAIEKKMLLREVSLLRKEVRKKYEFGNLIGKSKAMQEVFDLIKRVADSRTTVLIYGKSGTGKELVAKAIHYKSPRKDNPFVPVNCSAIPENLLESELFGHVKGAFTGAIANKKGLFEVADGGTLFLDEVGELSSAMQVKLLRALQEKEIRPVGGTDSIQIDVRLIAATNRDLEEAVGNGDFREDLFYRLNVIQISLPDLRERPEDIPLLANHFLRKYASPDGDSPQEISPEAMSLLVNYNWPGNVRELENVIERAVTLGRHREINVNDLPTKIRASRADLLEKALEREATLEDLEREYIIKVLQKTGGHQIRAASILGIDRRTLYRKMKKYGLGHNASSLS